MGAVTVKVDVIGERSHHDRHRAIQFRGLHGKEGSSCHDGDGMSVGSLTRQSHCT